MGFFFTQEDRAQKSSSFKGVPVESLHELECLACPLDRAPGLSNPKMEPTGARRPLVYILGEAPGVTEDLEGKQFVGDAGQLLRSVLPPALLKKARFNNCIRTHPNKNRDPSPIEIECCRPSIVRDIVASRPAAIFGFGNVPLMWACGEVWSSGIQLRRGRRVPVKIGTHTCWFFPMLHPSYILRMGVDKGPGKMFFDVFKKDIARAWEFIQTGEEPYVVPAEEQREGVTCITQCTKTSVQQILKTLWKWHGTDAVVGVDLETSSLRPYDGEIMTMALGTESEVVAFPIHHPEATWRPEVFQELWQGLLEWFAASECIKTAHKLDFELEWLIVKFGKKVLNRQWWHDTQGQAYCLDERKGALSLDDLVFQYFGFGLKQLSSVDLKNVAREPLEKILPYNGLDSKWDSALFQIQQYELEREGLVEVYEEQRRRVPTLALTKTMGLCVNDQVVQKFSLDLHEKLESVQAQIAALPVSQEYMEQKGAPLNIRSNPELAYCFNTLLHCPEVLTPQGKISTEEQYLAQVDHPLAKLILEFRGHDKLRSTYVDSFLPGGECLRGDGKIHPDFSCNYTWTRRLSSSSPNIQNFPKRSDSWVRELIKAPPGYAIFALDYGQIEFRVIAMASRDTTVIQALNERYDVHMEWAERYAYAYPDLVGGKRYVKDKPLLKKLRSIIKNKVVFPLFFGSFSQNISDDMGIPLHIVDPLVDEFWQQFDGVLQWQERLVKSYYKRGYVETLTGWRRRAPLKRNKIINTPIQGTASDIVIDAMNRLSEKGEALDCIVYQAIWNIHDDLGFYTPENKLEEYAEILVREMLACSFPFVNVPLSVEVSMGQDWGHMEEIATFYSDEF